MYQDYRYKLTFGNWKHTWPIKIEILDLRHWRYCKEDVQTFCLCQTVNDPEDINSVISTSFINVWRSANFQLLGWLLERNAHLEDDDMGLAPAVHLPDILVLDEWPFEERSNPLRLIVMWELSSSILASVLVNSPKVSSATVYCLALLSVLAARLRLGEEIARSMNPYPKYLKGHILKCLTGKFSSRSACALSLRGRPRPLAGGAFVLRATDGVG